MIKVMHVIWSATIGGIERVVLDLITEQQKNTGLKISLLIGKTEGDLLDSFSSVINDIQYAGLHSGSDLQTGKYRKLKTLFSRYDIIHIHSFNPLIAKAAADSEALIIYSEHGNFGIGKRKTFSDRLVRFLQKRFLNKNVRTIIFNSSYSHALSQKRYGLNKVNQLVIYNGIRFSEAQPAEDLRDQLRDQFVIGTIARFAGVKRIDRLLNAFSIFSKKHDSRLLLIGDGPLKNELEHHARQSNIIDKVLFAGYRRDARNCLQLMDIFVLSSEHEAFGLAVIEALDAGLPVLVFEDAGGPVELVKDLEPYDICSSVEELASRIEYYYKNPLNSTLKTIRQQYARKFSIVRMEEEIYKVYKDVRN